MKKIIGFCLGLAAFAGGLSTARADEVTDWNTIMFQAAFVAGTSPLNMTRTDKGITLIGVSPDHRALLDLIYGLDLEPLPKVAFVPRGRWGSITHELTQRSPVTD